jgi:hypothetical protein
MFGSSAEKSEPLPTRVIHLDGDEPHVFQIMEKHPDGTETHISQIRMGTREDALLNTSLTRRHGRATIS